LSGINTMDFALLKRRRKIKSELYNVCVLKSLRFRTIITQSWTVEAVCSIIELHSYKIYLILQVKLKVKLSLCVIKHHAMKTYGEWSYSSTILDLGTRWRRAVSFTPHPLYSRGRAPYTHWLGESQNRSGRCEVEKNLLPLSGIEPWPSSP
jgi:hypothetical protein